MRFILFILLLTLPFAVSAQRFKAGLSAGITASDVYGADIVPDADAWNDTDFRKLGILIGGNVQTAVGRKARIQMEINYTQKGTQQSGDSTGMGFYRFTFNYVEVPLLIKYSPYLNEAGKKLKGLDIHIGISAAQLVRSKGEGTNFYMVNDYSYLNKTDIGLVAGVGYHFSEHINFSFRYSNSLIPVFKRNNSPIFFAQSLNVGNSLVLHFILQYTFGTGRNTSFPGAE